MLGQTHGSSWIQRVWSYEAEFLAVEISGLISGCSLLVSTKAPRDWQTQRVAHANLILVEMSVHYEKCGITSSYRSTVLVLVIA